jgi:hypothetical protein
MKSIVENERTLLDHLTCYDHLEPCEVCGVNIHYNSKYDANVRCDCCYCYYCGSPYCHNNECCCTQYE